MEILYRLMEAVDNLTSINHQSENELRQIFKKQRKEFKEQNGNVASKLRNEGLTDAVSSIAGAVIGVFNEPAGKVVAQVGHIAKTFQESSRSRLNGELTLLQGDLSDTNDLTRKTSDVGQKAIDTVSRMQELNAQGFHR